jgi:hypothetical protein
MIGYIAIGVGVLTIIITLIGQSLYNTQRKFNDYITEATIIKIKTHTYWERGQKEEQLIPVLSYIVNGKKYKTEYVPEFHINMTRENTYVGKKIKIACSSRNPEYFNVLSYGKKEDDSKFYIKLGIAILIIGLVFVLTE